jgi:hypothetical protein
MFDRLVFSCNSNLLKVSKKFKKLAHPLDMSLQSVPLVPDN